MPIDTTERVRLSLAEARLLSERAMRGLRLGVRLPEDAAVDEHGRSTTAGTWREA